MIYFEIKSTIASEKIREIGNLGCLREKLKNMMYKEKPAKFLVFFSYKITFYIER